jgi:glycosyltransferase involved in cell wall biosynthesis
MPGQVSQERAALFLNAADVLVIPDTVTQMTASPLKLFEYMAVGKPIVVKEMPALREVLGDSAAEYFREGYAADLAASLDRLIHDRARAAAIAASALDRSRGYTYRARAQKIAEVVSSC